MKYVLPLIVLSMSLLPACADDPSAEPDPSFTLVEPTTDCATGGSIAATTDEIIWSTVCSQHPSEPESRIRFVSKNGGAPTTLADSVAGFVALATESSDIFFTNWGASGKPSQLSKITIEGGSPILISEREGESPYYLDVDATHVYYTDWSGAEVRRISTQGGHADVIGQVSNDGLIAIDDTHVFIASECQWSIFCLDEFGEGGDVVSISKAGGPISILVSKIPNIHSIVAHGDEVLIAARDGVFAVSKAGGELRDIAAGESALALAVADSDVYFATATAIWRAPLEGGTATELTSGKTRAMDMVVDARFVYWVEATGAVKRVAR